MVCCKEIVLPMYLLILTLSILEVRFYTLLLFHLFLLINLRSFPLKIFQSIYRINGENWKFIFGGQILQLNNLLSWKFLLILLTYGFNQFQLGWKYIALLRLYFIILIGNKYTLPFSFVSKSILYVLDMFLVWKKHYLIAL